MAVGDSGEGVLSGLPEGLELVRRGEAARDATCDRMFLASTLLGERWARGEEAPWPVLEL